MFYSRTTPTTNPHYKELLWYDPSWDLTVKLQRLTFECNLKLISINQL